MEEPQVSPIQPITQSIPPDTQPDLKPTPPTPSKVPVISLSIIALLSLLGLSYFYLQNQSLKQQTESALTPTPSVLPQSSSASELSTPIMANWKSYTIKELKLSFQLPPQISDLGNWETVNIPGDTGNNICFQTPLKNSLLIKTVKAGGVGLCNFTKFGINSVSSDFTAGRGPSFSDYSGYIEQDGKFYTNSKDANAGTNNISLDVAKKITNKNGVTYLRLVGKNTNLGELNMPALGSPGEGSIAAFVNTTNPQYPSINVLMILDSQLTPEIFDQILATFQFTK